MIRLERALNTLCWLLVVANEVAANRNIHFPLTSMSLHVVTSGTIEGDHYQA